MQLLLIRHGQSLGNIESRIQGDDDPLTDHGRSQARALAQEIARRGTVTHLYASPLARAWETASIIGNAIGIAPVGEAGLAEINAGRAAGSLWEEWRAANPDRAEIMANPQRGVLEGWEGGENGRDFGDRVLRAYRDIVANHLGTDDVVAAVGHGGSLAWIAASVHGDPLDVWPGLRAGFSNCSISEITVDAEGIGTPGPWNQTDHLAGL